MLIPVPKRAAVAAYGHYGAGIEGRAEGGGEAHHELWGEVHVELAAHDAALEDGTQAHRLVDQGLRYVGPALDSLVRVYFDIRGDGGPFADDDVVA
jgi:hypothetical protein